ncbi:hypothetical protein [Evansella cellulosilytica]|uniref:Uncharacterized protein n=1 Tax=Evansella cellulosilytica (strain ATCC 21833 / DSM 2522 / FERM P-1141 / JCM 9156 / N-4) TaxID=649639 RepID=E6TU66_EVAC2|nr:hypothetical protein [Evansella cellulosilytica]ADU28526.1 hypothetical protein Bcell_0239 [Evansella cellulosilytica DSM 2522]
MTQPSNTFKVATDLFLIQMKWSLWFIPIVFAIYLIVIPLVPNLEELDLNFLAFQFQPSKIYMLVIGILTCFAFMSHYVKYGVTRNDYFYGAALAAIGVAISITVTSAILAGILQFTGTFISFSPGTANMEFIHSSSTWLVPIIVYSLIIITYYIAGWLIAIGFYRYGGFGGMGFILISITFITLIDLLWEGDPTAPMLGWLSIPFPNLSFSVAAILSGLVIVCGMWITLLTTKRVTIKVE